MIVCPGMHEAVVGTYFNEYNTDVPVYDINKVIKLFRRANKSREFAIEWMAGVHEHWAPAIRPLFINLDPEVPERLKRAQGPLN